jgi:hypothetical protein
MVVSSGTVSRPSMTIMLGATPITNCRRVIGILLGCVADVPAHHVR